jgi:hypothetical protein
MRYTLRIRICFVTVNRRIAVQRRGDKEKKLNIDYSLFV